MFSALGRLVSRRPWFVIGAWVLLAVVVVSLAPSLSTTTDESEFLPDHYESIKAATVQADEFSDSTTPAAILVFQRDDGGKLTAEDEQQVTKVAEALGPELGKDTFVQQVVTVDQDGKPYVSEDGTVAIGVIGLAEGSTGFDTQAIDDGREMRDSLEPLVKGSGLTVQSTGAVPQSVDQEDASAQTLAIVGIATIVLIVVLLALIFHSVIICLMPILVVFLVSSIATGLIAWANDIFDLKADSSIQVILLVVLYGIGTDYILFFLFRYRERLRQGEDVRPSVVHALTRAGEAIASAGGAVIVAFLALILSSLSIFRAIGPALAIAVAVTLLAVLTLVPAVVTLLGRKLFWPSRKWQQEREGHTFERLGDSLGRRPGRFAAVTGLVLAALAVVALGFNASFDFNSSLPEDEESTKALVTSRSTSPRVRRSRRRSCWSRTTTLRSTRPTLTRSRRSSRVSRASTRCSRVGRPRTARQRSSPWSSTTTPSPTPRSRTSRARSATPPMRQHLTAPRRTSAARRRSSSTFKRRWPGTTPSSSRSQH